MLRYAPIASCIASTPNFSICFRIFFRRRIEKREPQHQLVVRADGFRQLGQLEIVQAHPVREFLFKLPDASKIYAEQIGHEPFQQVLVSHKQHLEQSVCLERVFELRFARNSLPG
jgi:hypothetical protein